MLHRFDKASYFYIYYNSTRHTSRIEVANNPGTPDQDAFNGYLDTCRFVNSPRFPTLLTILVDGITPTSPTSPKTGRDPEEWRLTSGDPRDPNRTKYRIHTLDVYLWAQEDATLVTEALRRLLSARQLDFPQPELETQGQNKAADHTTSPMSPVVQNLEHMAVTDPVYNGQNRNSNPTYSATSPTLSFTSHGIPPPPPPQTGPPHRTSDLHSPSPTFSDMSQPARYPATGTKSQPEFTPMAYNPAAPPAPEPIAHREKTPPPEDGDTGTGLAHAIKHDQGYVPGPPAGGYQIGQGPPVTFGGGYASPPPQQPGYTVPPPPPPQAGAAYSPSPPVQYPYSPSQGTTRASNTPSFGLPPTQHPNQHDPHHSVAAETYVPAQSPEQPVLTPGTQFYGSLGSVSGSKPLAHVQPQYPDYLAAGGPNAPAAVMAPLTNSFSAPSHHQPPPGGYSTYDYRSPRPPSQHANMYDIHQQVYRPTEAEASSHGRKPRVNSNHSGSMDRLDRKESRGEKVEKGVGRLFKKIEKKIG